MTFEAILDPQERVDYTIDYSLHLDESDPADQLVTSTWTIVSPESGGPLIVTNSIIDFNKAVVWVTGGGRLNSIHRLTNHVVCVSTREFERTIKITIRQK